MRNTVVTCVLGVGLISVALTPAAASSTARTPTPTRPAQSMWQSHLTEPPGMDMHSCSSAAPLTVESTKGPGRSTQATGFLSSKVRFVDLPPASRDDGSIGNAEETDIGTTRSGIRSHGMIGDGPHAEAGDAKGDFDFFSLYARSGQTITAKLFAPSIDSAITLYDAKGSVIASADDSAGTLNPTLIEKVAVSGTYYVMVAGSGSHPHDPFNSGSGDGVADEGEYSLSLSAALVGTHFYSVHLRAGDVVGGAVEGSPDSVAIYDAQGVKGQGSTGNVAHNHPAASPLPSGKISFDHIAARTGRYCIAVSGDTAGVYRLKVLVTRPNLESTNRVQTIFLDFDGALLDPSIFSSSGLEPTPGARKTSPLGAFLEAWGLEPGEEGILADAITAKVRRTMEADLAESGRNKRFGVRILSSFHDADPAESENVSRVIIGGTIDETGLPTLGVTSSIDPGNFDPRDTSIVLLDVLSGPKADPSSLNHFMNPSSDRVSFISTVVSNLISHEVGHALGNWHVEKNEVATLMDNDSTFLSVGPDGIGGTVDDDEPQTFGTDVFSGADGLTGTEDSLTRSSFGLSR